jgi:hypothetical protein
VVSVLDTVPAVESALNTGRTYETSNFISVGKFLRQLNDSQIFNKNMAEHRSLTCSAAASYSGGLGSELSSEASYTDIRFSLLVSAYKHQNSSSLGTWTAPFQIPFSSLFTDYPNVEHYNQSWRNHCKVRMESNCPCPRHEGM